MNSAQGFRQTKHGRFQFCVADSFQKAWASRNSPVKQGVVQSCENVECVEPIKKDLAGHWATRTHAEAVEKFLFSWNVSIENEH